MCHWLKWEDVTCASRVPCALWLAIPPRQVVVAGMTGGVARGVIEAAGRHVAVNHMAASS